MVLMTMIGRIPDGLPLAATMQEDEQPGRNLIEYQNQAKLLFKKLNNQSLTQCSIETGPFLFHYLIDHDVCFLILCEKNYSKRLAFSFLEDISLEFNSQYGKRVNSVTRPYSFIEFGIPDIFDFTGSIPPLRKAWTQKSGIMARRDFHTYIQKAKKTYTDSRVRRNLNTLNNELQDVQRIMVQNIDDVLRRGTVLSELDDKAQNLSMLSQKYKKDAAYLNTKSFYMKVAAGCFVFAVFVLYFWVF